MRLTLVAGALLGFAVLSTTVTAAGTGASTSRLAFRARFAIRSNDAFCPKGRSGVLSCHLNTGHGIVPGLGVVAESYPYDVDYGPCTDLTGVVVLDYAARFVVRGKGEIDLAVVGGADCATTATLVRSHAFTVTGGTGAYAGASGRGTLHIRWHYGGLGALGTDTWTGSLDAPNVAFDVVAPVLRGAVDRTVHLPRGAARVRVQYRVAARDAVDGAVAVSCRPRSGSSFGVGRTTVACSALDTSGNTARGSFAVTVKR